MGILDKIRLKMKKSVKEEERKIKRTYKGNEFTKQQLKEIRQLAAKKVLRKYVTATALTAAMTAALVGVGVQAKGNHGKDTKETTSISEELETYTNDTENIIKEDDELDIIYNEIDGITTKEEALQFVKKMYLDEYNKANDTNIYADDIEFYSKNQDKVYVVDGMYVTHGAYPDSVTNKLENNEHEYNIQENVKVYSILHKDVDGKKSSLENFAIDENADFVNAVLGDEYLNGNEIDSNKTNTAIKMGDVIEDSLDLAIVIGNGAKKEDVEAYKKQLKNTLKEYKEKSIEKEVEAR